MKGEVGVGTGYQVLLRGLFVCGLQGLASVLEKENINVIIDLRAEAQQLDNNKSRIHIPLIDGEPNQSDLLREAIQVVVSSYQEGKQVVLH